ncbi:hypothetical protein EUX98_g5468 [Antrodiella citrinella]|uniref:Zn(2)-C6 fungal-type domain-containing protein n=1 Tax=Antrodiella citrinella TaxID=2447956 RepID=A0A4S4MZ81_9APHY|nr:hypothetical protein EUX98_g5468 [Antrodiella citrinella]
MTTYQLSFDDAGHHIHRPYHPRDLDLGISIGRRSPISYEPLDIYLPASLGRHSFSHMPPPQFQFSDFIHEDPHGFTNPWSQQPVVYNSQGIPHPLAHHPEHPPLQEPVPIRHSSPQILYPVANRVEEPDAPRAQFLDENAGSNSNMLYFPSAPSMFAPSGGPWTVPQQQDQPAPEPQPSWTMSGSLDPNTGIFQRAPEHPRVRTAQACEKCRARKAKCSGEHPACQRCRTRGLSCEYAPERKMRGPNKVKRKSGIAVSNAASRRASVASSSAGSGSEDGMSNPSKPSLTVMSKKSSVDSIASDVPSPTDSTSGQQQISQKSVASKRLQRLRPPALDLKRTSMFELQTEFLNHVNAQPRSADPPADDDSMFSRRSSLPSYLLDNYTRTPPPNGFLAELTQRPYSTQPYTFGNPSDSVFNIEDRFAAHQSLSTPITPITTNAPDLSFRHSGLAQFILPQFSPSAVDPHEAYMAAVESHYGVGPTDIDSGMAWPESIIDLDPTPTAGPNGQEKNLAQVESRMLAMEA